MSGLYIHIPFCKQACHYCDFHFSTNLSTKNQLVSALVKELALQKEYLEKNTVLETIYVGGGTPSLLSEAELIDIFEAIHKYFSIAPNPEITLEANPDDLTTQKLSQLKNSPINRFSIGIQSFYQPHLRYLNRAHNAQEAKDCVKKAQDTGFNNISIDLIYAIPHPDHSVWEQDMATALQLNIQHISAYCLTIENRTAFGKWLRSGKIQAIDEEYSAQQFISLMHTLQNNGFEQYEISNFALPGHEARHNSNYWKKQPYLGIGPSAHSYNESTRQFNVASNTQYMKSLEKEMVPYTLETLTIADQVNEYIMTSLRTKWGCNLESIKNWAGIDIQASNKIYLADCLKRNLVTLENEVLKLTESGKLVADQIASDLFIVE
ncbi:radical SAM family heme chaperone HemW [Rhodocytophaga rosea]|uniref:Heme chaperone HemW n=1 Tax=Rhodocytophaga rosea TaxID=2704465 RepID=A0A6C0GN32_9BACT|nr:radical SAM family heme chaperone HemW [Rhodocytophaga rosea]QHT69012.1 radical SAM family heme chaperone HemW [Rhodocytophaga rosea]